jgi:hypothetical protein
MLKNRFYAGEVAYRGEVHKGEHAAIVDREIFDRVQAMLSERTVARTLKRGNSPVKAALFLLGERFSIEYNDRTFFVVLAKQHCEFRLPLGLGQPLVIQLLEFDYGFCEQVIRTRVPAPVGIRVGTVIAGGCNHAIDIGLGEGTYVKLIHSGTVAMSIPDFIKRLFCSTDSLVQQRSAAGRQSSRN